MQASHNLAYQMRAAHIMQLLVSLLACLCMLQPAPNNRLFGRCLHHWVRIQRGEAANYTSLLDSPKLPTALPFLLERWPQSNSRGCIVYNVSDHNITHQIEVVWLRHKFVSMF